MGEVAKGQRTQMEPKWDRKYSQCVMVIELMGYGCTRIGKRNGTEMEPDRGEEGHDVLPLA